jgi:hypothetical protein
MPVLKKTEPPPRVRLFIRSAESLVEDIAFFGRSVGPRNGTRRRTHGEMEDYCLRRWLAAASASEILEPPVEVVGFSGSPNAAKPDFVLHWPSTGRLIGVEVTAAGDASWQKWLTKTERIDELQLYPNAGGYAGNAPERIVAKDIRNAIKKKVQSASDGKYRGAQQYRLLIYENSEGGLLARRGEAVELLRQEMQAEGATVRQHFIAVDLIFGNSVYLDLLGEQPAEIDLTENYADDWIGWLQQQAARLRTRDFGRLDADNLAEEMESLSRSEQRALASHLRLLLLHLLKWRFQASNQSRSWAASIGNARDEIRDLAAESPSLMNRLSEVIESAYIRARREAILETGLPEATFPEACPYTIDQLLDDEFLPT